MKLRGYDLLTGIRGAGMKPTHVSLYLFPVKIYPLSPGFYDATLCTRDDVSQLGEYDLNAMRGLDVMLVGKAKDERLRGACRLLSRLADMLIVTSDEHVGVDIFHKGKWA